MMNFPLARRLGHDNGWINQFQRLIETDPPEIAIWDHTRFEPCAVFDGKPCDCGAPDWAIEAGGRHWEGIVVWTDLEFWFPCDDPFHRGCGFFEWTLCLQTAGHQRQCKDEGEEPHDSWDVVLIDAPTINEKDLPGIAHRWLELWIPQLASKPIRCVSYEESRSNWARFEEMHPDAEHEDIMRICQQRILEIESGTAKLVPIDAVLGLDGNQTGTNIL